MTDRITHALTNAPDGPMTQQVATSILTEFGPESAQERDFLQQLDAMLDMGFELTTELLVRIYDVVQVTWMPVIEW